MDIQQLVSELSAVSAIGGVEVRTADERGDRTAADLVDAVHDSRQAYPGAMFCAVPGLTVDGHDFIDAAIGNNASALLVERWVLCDRPQVKVASVRRAMPHVAAILHGHPSRRLDVFAVTGTNGKTTTTKLFADIMQHAGRKCEVVGTLGGAHTTPESTDLQRRLQTYVEDGVDVVAIEVSSHALDQHRFDACDATVAAFSNLTPDHLDYHGDMEQYFEAKKRLFDGRATHELITIDDRWGARLADERRDAATVSVHDVEILRESLAGTDYLWRGHQVRVPLPGLMNVANSLVASEAAFMLGVDAATIVEGLGAASPVPGRMQPVVSPYDSAPMVVVDYSHTPDSISRALNTLRAINETGRVIIVFGCGGDRDRLKRPLMGSAAEAGADAVYLTSDNPRSEDPLLIIADALAGISNPDEVIVEPDRRRAIERAIIEAGPDDVVLIAGKGHETTQTIGFDVLPFDDVLVALEVLEVTGS